LSALGNIAAVALGGALGSLSRWGVSEWVRARGVDPASGDFPWGTLIVNASGSLLIGLVYGLLGSGLLGSGAARAAGAGPVHLFAAIGFLGAFTTFSTFSYETLALMQHGHTAKALGYAASSTLLGVALAFAGVAAGVLLRRI
jgi:CrcB protein